MIIAISGKIGSGKDTVGTIIRWLTTYLGDRPDINSIEQRVKDAIQYYNSDVAGGRSDWQIRKFADKLKEICSLLTGIPRADFEKQEVKDRFLPELGMTVRKLMTSVGGSEIDGLRKEVHMDIWVHALFTDYQISDLAKAKLRRHGPRPSVEDVMETLPNWIITDMRFPNELKAVKDHGGITIRVERDTYLRTGKFNLDPHPSETSLDDANFDYIIDNNGTVEELVEKIKQILKAEKII